MKRLSLILRTFLTLAPVARAAEVLPFVEDDYAKAVASAKTKHVPLFVDAWAPW